MHKNRHSKVAPGDEAWGDGVLGCFEAMGCYCTRGELDPWVLQAPRDLAWLPFVPMECSSSALPRKMSDRAAKRVPRRS